MSELKTCPYCGDKNCKADFVDIGVGNLKCGPYTCESCHAVEIGPNDDPRRVLTERELATGWYEPDDGPPQEGNGDE